ncbi:MAG: hypothetical protein ACREDZ_12530 [Kiloniellales bacterium]
MTRKLGLSVAVGDYDRTRPLVDGAVQIDGVEPIYMRLSPEEIFFRALRNAEFDVCELSLSSFTVKTAQGNCPYVGIPAFVSRAFRHTSIYINKERGIEKPEDLKGRRVGVPEYQLTACVWARAILEDDHGVTPADLRWLYGGIEEAGGRAEKVAVSLPKEVTLQPIPDDRTLSGMLADGEIDALVTPRAPSSYGRAASVGWLYPDPVAAGQDYYRRTGIFPIMHLLGLRRDLAEAHPWLPVALLKAFEQSKQLALAKLADTSATKVTLPFVEEQLKAARDLMGPDYWSYGIKKNVKTLDSFLRHHHAQGLSTRRLEVEELFHPTTLETVVY